MAQDDCVQGRLDGRLGAAHDRELPHHSLESLTVHLQKAVQSLTTRSPGEHRVPVAPGFALGRAKRKDMSLEGGSYPDNVDGRGYPSSQALENGLPVATRTLER